MIPFRELQNLANAYRDKSGNSIQIAVEHWSFGPSKSYKIRYCVYVHSIIHQNFETVRELKTAIRNLIDPPQDAGVTLSERKEQVDGN